MSVSITPPSEHDELDRLLFSMLTSDDEQMFERQLTAYYVKALPKVARYVAREVRHWLLDATDVENLVQDVLATFILTVGSQRRRASAALGAAIQELHPLEPDGMQARLLVNWRIAVRSFHERAMSFSLDVEASPAPPATIPSVETGLNWRARRDAVNAQVPGLQRRGMTFLFEARSHFLESSSPLIASRLEILTDAISARRSTNAKDNTLGARELRKHHVSALRRGGCKPEDLSYGRLTLAFGAVFPEWIDGEARAPDATEQMRSFIQGGFISYVRAVYCVTLHLPDLSIRSHDYLQQSCRNNALNLLAKRKRDYEQGRAEAREQPIEEERCTVAEPPATVPLRLVIQILLRPLRQARRKYLGAIVHSSTATRELQTLTTRRKKYLQLRRVMRLWSQDYDEKEIMQKCNLSRPQVRYAISQLKAAITQAHVEGIETLSAQFSGGAVK